MSSSKAYAKCRRFLLTVEEILELVLAATSDDKLLELDAEDEIGSDGSRRLPDGVENVVIRTDANEGYDRGI